MYFMIFIKLANIRSVSNETATNITYTRASLKYSNQVCYENRKIIRNGDVNQIMFLLY